MPLTEEDLLTDDEYAASPARERTIHPICRTLRDLRKAAGYSLSEFESRFGIAAVAIGSYERGDRVPSINKMDQALRCFGYRLAAVPIAEEPATPAKVRTDDMIVAELRAIADQIAAIGEDRS